MREVTTSLTNLLNAALYTGVYSSSLGASSTSAQLVSGLLGSSSSLGVTNYDVLSSALTSTYTTDEANILANAVDSDTMQAILLTTNYSENMNLFSALNTSLYAEAFNLLQSTYSPDLSGLDISV